MEKVTLSKLTARKKPIWLSSCVLPGDAQVEIRVGAKANDVTLTCDGQVGCELQSGDIVRVKQADLPLFLIKSRQEDYFTILRNKLKWGHRDILD